MMSSLDSTRPLLNTKTNSCIFTSYVLAQNTERKAASAHPPHAFHKQRMAISLWAWEAANSSTMCCRSLDVPTLWGSQNEAKLFQVKHSKDPHSTVWKGSFIYSTLWEQFLSAIYSQYLYWPGAASHYFLGHIPGQLVTSLPWVCSDVSLGVRH